MMKRVKILVFKPKYVKEILFYLGCIFLFFFSFWVLLDSIANPESPYGTSRLPYQPTFAIVYYMSLLLMGIAKFVYEDNKSEIEQEVQMLEQGENKRVE